MVGWTEEGRKEGGGEERGEENDVSSSWKMKENGSLTCLKWDASRRVASAASTHRVGLAFWSYFQNPCIQRSLCVIFFLRWPDTFHPLPLLPSISRRFSKIFSRTVSFSTFSFTLSCLDRSTIDQRTNVRSIYRTGSVKQIFRAGGGGGNKSEKSGKNVRGEIGDGALERKRRRELRDPDRSARTHHHHHDRANDQRDRQRYKLLTRIGHFIYLEIAIVLHPPLRNDRSERTFSLVSEGGNGGNGKNPGAAQVARNHWAHLDLRQHLCD